MAILTVIRRLCIFLVCFSILCNVFLLLIAKAQAGNPREQNEAIFRLRVRMADRSAADDLANSIRKYKPNLTSATVTASQIQDEVSSGKFVVGIDLEASLAATVARTLNNAGNQVVSENAENGYKRVRLQKVFDSKNEAQASAQRVNASVSNTVNMQAVEVRKKVPATVYVVDVVVADEAALDDLKRYVEGKAPPGSIQQ